MPISSGRPMCTGAPCTPGKREVICTARIASAGRNERIDTTSGPWNGPAGSVRIEVRYIGTLRPALMWRSGRPSSSSAHSNEYEQPRMKLTRSSRHRWAMSVGSSTISPLRNTR